MRTTSQKSENVDMPMKTLIRLIVLLTSTLLYMQAFAEEVTKEQLKGLDEQVQDIKKDVLGISAELNQLEEKLLYPSNTQISFFVSVVKDSGFQPDSIQIKLDEKDVAHHIYSFKEVEALQNGGVQRVYTGNVRTGDHNVKVSIVGKSGGSKTTDSVSQVVNKGIKPQIVEIKLSGSGIEVNNW